jgi:hypothetical protein
MEAGCSAPERGSLESRRSIVRPWFWPALVGVAIAIGALVEWIRSPAPPAPSAPEAAAPAAIVPPRAEPAPDAGAPRPYVAPTPAPAPPPMPRSEYPRARPAPGTEPRVPFTGDPTADRRQALTQAARRWAQSVRGVRPDILDQMREGKRLERERILREIDAAEAAVRENPGDRLRMRKLQALKDDLYYLEQSIDQLETVRQEAR